MATDTSRPIPGGVRPSWDLPEIVDIQIRRIHFEPRKPRNFRSALADYAEAVEFLVHTSGPIPARALGPALFVGDLQVVESQRVDNNVYRFVTVEIDRLKRNALISWGWINSPREQRQKTKFRFGETR